MSEETEKNTRNGRQAYWRKGDCLVTVIGLGPTFWNTHYMRAIFEDREILIPEKDLRYIATGGRAAG
jgi:hypothetical protein